MLHQLPVAKVTQCLAAAGLQDDSQLEHLELGREEDGLATFSGKKDIGGQRFY